MLKRPHSAASVFVMCTTPAFDASYEALQLAIVADIDPMLMILPSVRLSGGSSAGPRPGHRETSRSSSRR